METVITVIKQIGEWLVPILTSAGFITLVVKAILDKVKNSKINKKFTTIVDLLESILEKNTCEDDVKTNTEEVHKLKSEIEELKKLIKNDDQVAHDQTATLGQMIGVIFENSSLPAETKERLRTLKTKIEYSSDAKVVEELISENSKLRQKVSVLDNELQSVKREEQVQIVHDNVADTMVELKPNKSTIVIQ